jgi:hypothetical protein
MAGRRMAFAYETACLGVVLTEQDMFLNFFPP